MSIFLICIAITLAVSFLCSLMEATLLSLTPIQIAEISARNARLGGIWRGFKAQIEHPVAVILILNTATNVIGASVAGVEFSKLYGEQFQQFRWIFPIVFALVIFQFAELLPKTLGVRFNRELAHVIARPLEFAVAVLLPLLHVLQWINRLFVSKRKSASAVPTLDEIAALAGLARLSEEIGGHQERIINGAFRLSHATARQVMIPAEQASYLSAASRIDEALVAAHLDAHTRYPVCEDGDRNRVIGYVNFKEMVYFMQTNPREPNLRGIVRPLHFVPPDERAAELLRVFVEEHVHMAIVRDEGDRTLGLVTLEDLVEELVGDIEDEFDRLPRMFHALSGGTWMVGGGIPAGTLAQSLGMPLPEAQGTVSAWLCRRLGRAPAVGEVHRVEGLTFTIRRVRRGKIFEAAVTKD
jgi:putative hemolysin